MSSDDSWARCFSDPVWRVLSKGGPEALLEHMDNRQCEEPLGFDGLRRMLLEAAIFALIVPGESFRNHTPLVPGDGNGDGESEAMMGTGKTPVTKAL